MTELHVSIFVKYFVILQSNNCCYVYYLGNNFPSTSRQPCSPTEVGALSTSNISLNGRQRSYSDSRGKFVNCFLLSYI